MRTGVLTNSVSRAYSAAFEGASEATTRKIVTAVGEHVGIEQQSILGHARADQLPFLFVFGAEIDGIDQLVAVGIVGLPGDLGLRGLQARDGLVGSRAGAGGGESPGIGDGDGVRRRRIRRYWLLF